MHSPSLVFSALLMTLLLPLEGQAQYFGRNKVQYDDFRFDVLETPNFDVHVYGRESDPYVQDASRMAERWYERLSRFFGHELADRNPLLLYADKPDFRQTNAVSSFLSEATGGVTESIKNRVIMPLSTSYGETDHVLGHELVHAFQYDLGRGRSGAGPMAINRLPLWAIEGLAEYLSLGREYTQTSMWLRDAAARDELPTLEEMSEDPQRYFPYRFGHAFWAWVGGRWGDGAVRALFLEAARSGLDRAIQEVLSRPADTLSAEWVRDTREHVAPLLTGRQSVDSVASPVLVEGTPGSRLNLGPVLSPDGSRVMFLSQRSLFSFDLYVADAASGEIQVRIGSQGGRNPHLEGIAFTESTGAWSPGGDTIAFVIDRDGDNGVALADSRNGRMIRTYPLPGVGAAYSLAWSPDGATLALSGSRGGVTDLYTLDVASGAVEPLTDDPWTQLHPDWSPDGRRLVFATDAGPGSDIGELTFQELGVGMLDLGTGEQTVSRPLPGGDHVNPRFSPDGEGIYFLSDWDGYRDLYRADTGFQSVERMTRLVTGIAGLSFHAPAMSVAENADQLFFTVFHRGDYLGYGADPLELSPERVRPGRAAAPARILPPAENTAEPQLVESYLDSPAIGRPDPATRYPVRSYDSDLRLDYIAQPTAGIAVDRFGTSLGGSIAAFFSDMLGNEILGLAVAAQGDVRDIGAEAVYRRMGDRFNWGVQGGRIPYRSGFSQVSDTTISGNPGRVVDIVIDRTAVNRAALFGDYPLSLTRRFEGDVGYTRYGFSREIRRAVLVGNTVVDQTEFDRPAPDALNLANVSLAFVEDYSFFGFTSPVRGGRTRLEVETHVGDLDFTNVLADYRRYLFLRPFTLAFRGIHFGRYGGSAEDPRLSPLFLGQQAFVRGYSVGSFDGDECTPVSGPGATCPELDRLAGSRIAVASLEWRIPLLGTEAFGILDWGFLPIELSLFADGGVAWTEDEAPELRLDERSTERIPVFSAGVSSRFNLLGRLIFEIYWAHPFQRPERGGVFGFHFAPGW